MPAYEEEKTVLIDGKSVVVKYTETEIGDKVYDFNSEHAYAADITDADDLNWIVQK